MDVKVRTCKICKRPCTEPKFLPCFHSFCKLCLKFEIIKVPTNHQWEGFSCPSCNTYTKAIDPDQPLATWADEFPDSMTRKRPMKKMGSSEEHSDSVTSPRTPNKPMRFPSTPGSPGPYSPISPRHFSPGQTSPGLSESPNSVGLQLTSVSTSGSESAMSPGPITPTSPDVFSLENTDSPSPGLKTSSKSSIGDDDSTQIGQEFSELSIPSPVSTLFTEDNEVPSTDSEEKMCAIHPWKPLIVSCQQCNSTACGQCLIETHPTCKGENFLSISKQPLLPDISVLEQEVHKVDQANEMINSSAYQLQQTQQLIRQKIKQIALLLIQKMKKEEKQMVKKVEQVYHDEIWRLKSGINPSESLLKQVKDLKDRTEDLSKQHPAAVVLQADSFQEEQNVLLNRVKAVDYSCVPPEVTFVPNYDILTLTLGDLVVDEGYFPKHDIPPEPVEDPETSSEHSAPETTQSSKSAPGTPECEQVTPDSPQTPEETSISGSGSSSSSKSKGSDQTGKQKSKSKSIFDKIRSPRQKQSKFFVKIPEL